MDEIEYGYVKMKMNADLWLGCEKESNPEGAFRERVLRELSFQGFKDDEIRAISSDGAFSESVAEVYRETNQRFRGWRKSIPGSVKIRYTALGTRTKRGKAVKESDGGD